MTIILYGHSPVVKGNNLNFKVSCEENQKPIIVAVRRTIANFALHFLFAVDANSRSWRHEQSAVVDDGKFVSRHSRRPHIFVDISNLFVFPFQR